MKILFYNKRNNSDKTDENFDNNSILKENYYGLILFARVFIAIIYSFGLGYALFYSGNIISNLIKFIQFVVLFYIILEPIYIFISSIILPDALSNNITINFKFFKSTNEAIKATSKKRLIISLIIPFIALSLLPNLISLQYSFNPVLYAFLYASTVKSISYIVYSLIIIIKDFDEELLIKEYGYINVKK